jgi:ATP/maltotriose-dependent transcriptional regulator MalT
MQRARRELEASVAEQEGSPDRATLGSTLVWLAYALAELGEHAEALRAVERLEAVGRDGGIRLFDALALICRSTLALAEGDPARAVELAGRALDLAYTPPARSGALAVLAEAEVAAGRLDEARAHAAELVQICRPGDDAGASFPHQLPEALLVVASLDLIAGELGRAEASAHEALVAAQTIGARNRMVDALEAIASTIGEIGSVGEAARLVGATEAARAATGYGRRFAARDSGATALRSAMGDEAFEAAAREGRTLTLEEAVEYARRGRGGRKRPTTGWASLTPIEAQVVDLVRRGMTNADIGTRLFVSPRTVQAHLSRIYTKLGVNGRTALAALPSGDD